MSRNNENGNCIASEKASAEGECESNVEKLDDDSFSTIDDDESNQRTQRHFFQLLAKHWAQPTRSKDCTLFAFLEEHAKGHMGWKHKSEAPP